MAPALLELTGVTFGTPDGRLLARRLDLRLLEGQCLLVSGPNGCGKSTLLKIILGRAPVSAGAVRCGVTAQAIAYIPQLENTDVHLPFTLRDVLESSLEGPLDRERLALAVSRVGLLPADRLDAAWNTASGGERKRTLLTRALLRQPDLLLFDEPMNHLDGESRGAVLVALSRYLREPAARPRAAVLVCHKGLYDDEESLFDVQRLHWESVMERTS